MIIKRYTRYREPKTDPIDCRKIREIFWVAKSKFQLTGYMGICGDMRTDHWKSLIQWDFEFSDSFFRNIAKPYIVRESNL